MPRAAAYPATTDPWLAHEMGSSGWLSFHNVVSSSIVLPIFRRLTMTCFVV